MVTEDQPCTNLDHVLPVHCHLNGREALPGWIGDNCTTHYIAQPWNPVPKPAAIVCPDCEHVINRHSDPAGKGAGCYLCDCTHTPDDVARILLDAARSSR